MDWRVVTGVRSGLEGCDWILSGLEGCDWNQEWIGGL